MNHIQKIVITISLFCTTLLCTAENRFYKNPIIPGFHPDPSICRVGDDYYLVNSSFEWFPGLPLHHSKDLVNWQQIGHVLDRPSQLAMKPGMKASAGLWAPTIRYHQGTFYVICTAQQAGGNFYVTSKTAEGPYSEPVFLKDAPGIDPSLFFDEDGTCWFTASINGTPKEDKYKNEDRIYMQELDLSQGKLVGDRTILTTGHAVNAPFTEAPHIYKIKGKYYLLVAEGGTWNNHAVTVFTSDKVTGPYEALYTNPVLTHRHLGNKEPITSVGHADMVQTQNGEWWAVMLGVRPFDGFSLLGRETFLTPVEFQGGTPIFNPGEGKVTFEGKAPNLPHSPFAPASPKDEFDGEKLLPQWSFLRTPFEKWYELADGFLTLKLRKETVKELVNPSLIARRVAHIDFNVETTFSFSAKNESEEAGLVIMQNDRFSYRLVSSKGAISLYKVESGVESLVVTKENKKAELTLGLKGRGLTYQFYVGGETFGEPQDARVCSTNRAGGFIGSFVGMYASSNGLESKNKATFDCFSYCEADEPILPELKRDVYTLNQIAIRDPFIVTDSLNQCYYLYGATRLEEDMPNGRHGVKMYKSKDLKSWEGPYLIYETSENSWADPYHGVWAPEVHKYKGNYYLFATLTNESQLLEVILNRPPIHSRATQVFQADSPYGPFVPIKNKPTTPEKWMALDGTLWVEDNVPYMVFCHEWVQTTDGGMVYAQLSEDLSSLVGSVVTMFKATDAPWVRSLNKYKEKPAKGYITDGCYLHKTKSGKLLMIWSSFSEKGYTVASAIAESGKISGEWKQQDKLIFESNGGHAMLFKSLDGKLMLPLHYPNSGSTPHCRIFEIKEENDRLLISAEFSN